MYEHVAGALVHCSDDTAVVEVGGIGYRLKIPASTATAIRGHERVRLLTALRLREERLVLYGFATAEERAVFDRLCAISGIGPGTAMTVLSGLPIDEFRVAILGGDVRLLQRIKGIGRKTAERLVLELKEVFAAEPLPAFSSTGSRVEGDAVSALVALGFPAGHAMEAVRAAVRDLPPGASLEEVIKRSSRRA